MKPTTSYFAGLDIGGTTVKAVLVDAQAEQAGPLVEVRSLVKDGYEATFSQLEQALDQLAAGAGIDRLAIAGIGLDVPAPSSDGVIWGRANLADDWVGTDIRGRLSARLGMPVFMTNDGNAAAVGEYALRKYHNSSLMLVAPGTGLGGGLVLPGGRLLEQRDVAWTKLNEIPGVSCVKPEGALYAFPRLDPEVHDIVDDEKLVLDLLLDEKILLTQGTGFNWPAPDHLRIVTLPWARDLSNAIERLGNFLANYRQ